MMSKGWRNLGVNWPTFQEQFETTKFSNCRFFTRVLTLEEFPIVVGEFQKRYALLQIALVSVLMLFDYPQDLALLAPPRGRLLVEDPSRRWAGRLLFPIRLVVLVEGQALLGSLHQLDVVRK